MRNVTGPLAALLPLLLLIMLPVTRGGPPNDRVPSTASDQPAGLQRAPQDKSRLHHEMPDDPPAARSVILRSQATMPARIWVRGPYESLQVNVDANGNNILGDAANEPSIAVDPGNPGRMSIGWRQFDTVESNFRQAGWAYSHDAGQTWTFTGVLEPGEFSSDPILDADAEGRFYYYALQPDRGPAPWACYLYRSDDAGVTWPQEVYARGGDKAWFTIDRTDGIGHGNLYLTWSSSFGCCGSGNFTRSTDGGSSFLQPIPVTEDPRWGTLTVGRAGKLYIAGGVGGGLHGVARSSNAQDPTATPFFDQFSFVDLGGTTVFSEGPNPGGLLGQVWIASDHSNGSTRGNLYMLSSVDPPGPDPLDVMFSRSTDDGLTWSEPLRVNDDPIFGNAWQWFGTMAVAPNGRIDVIWNDTRNSGVTRLSELFYSYSNDAGLNWSENIAISPEFDSLIGWPSQNKIGDYYDMVSDNFGASIAYAATFNGEQDVYYLRIGDLDCNDNGFPDAEDIAQNRSEDCNQNDLPDECDPDCNGNELVDECEIRDELSPDCDDNLVPDGCDPNFDGDEFVDGCDPDIDNDGVPNDVDVCDFTRLGFRVRANGAIISDLSFTNTSGICVVELIEFMRFDACLEYSGPGMPLFSTCADMYDYTGDFDIDLHDFWWFQRAIGP